jgi:hypothetical protein
MREKRLINSFALANLSDMVVTGVGLSLPGIREKGIQAEDMFAQGQVSEMLIIKVAVTAFMIGIYALAAHRNSRYHPAIEKALKIGTVLVWLAVAWNELTVGLTLSALLRGL